MSTRPDGNTPRVLATLKHDRSANVYGVHFTADGRRLISCSGDRTVRVWGSR